ncbi:MAG: hypothetical protein PHS46_08340 [Candidatus Omnitrophica bacterium]|nr:hypothetical protein [Candidatus Omnitrophota bacterium]
MRKTVAEIADQVIREAGREIIGWEDDNLFDEITRRATHTNLKRLSAEERKKRIFFYIEVSGMFVAGKVTEYRGNRSYETRLFRRISRPVIEEQTFPGL